MDKELLKLSKMKIAFYHNLALGGAQNMVAEFAMRLGRSHMVDVFYLRKKEENGRRPLLQNVHAEFTYPFSMIFGASNLIKNVFFLYDFKRLGKLSKKVASEIDAKQYDVVLVFGCRYTQTPLILKYLRTPSVYYCAEPWRFFSEKKLLRNRPLSIFKRLAFLILSPWLAFLRRSELNLPALATIVFTHSLYTQGLIKSTYGIDSRLCRLAIDLSKYGRVDQSRSSSLVLSVGAVCWIKGHEEAIRAIAFIDKPIKPQLMIIGHWADTSEPKRLTAIASDLGVDMKILVGKTTDKELIALYNRAKMVLCLAHSEPFGLTPLEAMACQVPVIAIKEGGYLETVIDGTTGFLVDRDINSIAAKIQELFNNEAKCLSMGAAGFDCVSKNWGWSAAEKTLEGLLAEAAGTKAFKK